MGGAVIEGEHWHASKLQLGDIMSFIQTPTVTPAAGASAVSNFATGLSTSLGAAGGAMGLALAIHAIRWNMFNTRALAAFADVTTVSLQGQITENVAQTAVALTDPRILAGCGLGESSILDTGVGGQHDWDQFLWTAEFDPPILTVAQNLRIVATSSATATFDCHAKIMYTILPVTQQIRDQLMLRLNVATQP